MVWTRVLQNPGTMHLLSNATVGLGAVMPNYKGNLFKMKCVCDWIRKRQSRPKLIETCFSSFWPMCDLTNKCDFTNKYWGRDLFLPLLAHV